MAKQKQWWETSKKGDFNSYYFLSATTYKCKKKYFLVRNPFIYRIWSGKFLICNWFCIISLDLLDSSLKSYFHLNFDFIFRWVRPAEETLPNSYQGSEYIPSINICIFQYFKGFNWDLKFPIWAGTWWVPLFFLTYFLCLLYLPWYYLLVYTSSIILSTN